MTIGPLFFLVALIAFIVGMCCVAPFAFVLSTLVVPHISYRVRGAIAFVVALPGTWFLGQALGTAHFSIWPFFLIGSLISAYTAWWLFRRKLTGFRDMARGILIVLVLLSGMLLLFVTVLSAVDLASLAHLSSHV